MSRKTLSNYNGILRERCIGNHKALVLGSVHASFIIKFNYMTTLYLSIYKKMIFFIKYKFQYLKCKFQLVIKYQKIYFYIRTKPR